VEKFNVLMYHELIKKADLNTDQGSQIKVKQDYQDKLPRALFVYLKEFKKQTDLEKVEKNEFIDDTRRCEKYIDSKNVYAFPFGKYKKDTV